MENFPWFAKRGNSSVLARKPWSIRTLFPGFRGKNFRATVETAENISAETMENIPQKTQKIGNRGNNDGKQYNLANKET